MRMISIGRFGKARVWLGELPLASFDTEGALQGTVVAGMCAPSLRDVAIEAVIPRGATSQYGLLGISATFEEATPDLRIEVPWTSNVQLFVGGLAAAPEVPGIGLREEYAQSVLEALQVCAQGKLGGGVLRISRAVCGAVGSSPSFMSKLANACVNLMLRRGIPDDEIGALLVRG